MKAREFIPEYDIDPDELHKAAYLQRKVDQYNARYKNKKPLAGASPTDDEPQKEPSFNPLGTFAQSFGKQLFDPDYEPDTVLTKGINLAKRLPGAVTNALYKSSSAK
jgi:hypothetical protein